MLDKEYSTRYELLSSKLKELFPQLQVGTFKVTYIDKDGDEVRVNLFSACNLLSFINAAAHKQ